MSVNIKYTVALFSALDVSVRKNNNMRLARFSRHFARNRMTPCVANVHGNHYTSTYFILSRPVIVSFSATLSLSLPGWYFRKKRVRVTAHLCLCQRAYSTYNKLNRGLWSVLNNYISHLGGYIYSIG